MAGFDGERYLRLIGERWVKKGGAARRPPRSPVLAAAAAALVAVDAITITAAQAVVGDYDLSRGQGHRDPVSGQPRRAAAPAPPGSGGFRVVACERVIDQPGAGSPSTTSRSPATRRPYEPIFVLLSRRRASRALTRFPGGRGS